PGPRPPRPPRGRCRRGRPERCPGSPRAPRRAARRSPRSPPPRTAPSPVPHPRLVEDLRERPGRPPEVVLAGEAAEHARGREVRLHRAEPVVAVGGERPDRGLDLAVALPRGHDRAVGQQGVLHLQVLHVRTEARIALGERPDADLHEVRRVPRQPQLRRADRLHDVQAALRGVAVDLLLVLVQQDHVVALGLGGERGHPAQHLVAVRHGVVALRDEEGEEPDVGRLQHPGDVQGAAHPHEVGVEVVEHPDLADRRADRGRADAGAVERRAHPLQLVVVEVQDVGVPRAAELDVADAQVGEHPALLVQVGGDLVGEAGEGPHADHPRRRVPAGAGAGSASRGSPGAEPGYGRRPRATARPGLEEAGPMTSTKPRARPRVVVVGGGFAGHSAARSLAKRLGDAAEIVLINPTDYFLYLPLLPEVAAGVIDPRRITVPLAATLPGVRVVLGEVGSVALDDRRIGWTDPESGRAEMGYDRLVLAVGSVHKLLPIPGVAEHARGFRGIPEALYRRDHVTRQIELAASTADPAEREARCTFVVVGAGYTGTEVAAQGPLLTDTLVRHHAALRDQPVRWLLLDLADRVLPELDPRLSGTADRVLRERGVEVRTGQSVQEAAHGHVLLTTGETVPTRTLVWCVGVRPDPLVEAFRLPTAKGRLVVDAEL